MVGASVGLPGLSSDMRSDIRKENAKPAISIIAHYAYGSLAVIDTGHIGGVEKQTSLMARWFAARGYPVSMITWDEGQPDGVEIEGVRVFKMCRKDAGIKGLRFFWPKWTGLCRAMRRANADIYYYNTGDQALGQIALWCHRNNRKCVYSVAATYNAKRVKLKPIRERSLFRYGLKHSDAVIVQTRRQQQMLREGFGIDSTIIHMPCEAPGNNEDVLPERTLEESPHVLWVGRISKEKRLEWLLAVAERCPEITFDVVGASNTDSIYTLALAKRAAGIPNVKMHGRVPHSEMGKYYRRSSVLCCTSAYEGFPNTFLEAWSFGIPVVSTFDPDGIVAEYGLGWTASSIDELAGGLKTAIASAEKWRAASHAARSYYLKNHTMDATMPEFEKVFAGLVGR